VGLQDDKKALISNSANFDLGNRKFVVNVSIIKDKTFLTKYLLSKNATNAQICRFLLYFLNLTKVLVSI
jgi:hypothetical protein